VPDAARVARGGLKMTPSNKRMYATADTRDVKFLLGAGRRVMRSVRSLESAAPILRAFRGGALERPNKRMHATRDTTDVMLRLGAGGRVMRGVRR
jgi:hypothetical protein